jgi:hypothetical protein
MPRGNPGRLKHILTGRTFGRLKVIGFYGRIETGVLRAWRNEKRPGFPLPMRIGQPYWRCRCACGGESIVSTWNLMRETPPHSRSCGCIRAEKQKLKLKAALTLLAMVESAQKAA